MGEITTMKVFVVGWNSFLLTFVVISDQNATFFSKWPQFAGN
jgi:hypothetical protein